LFEAEARRPCLLPSTAQRLQREIALTHRLVDEMRALLAPLGSELAVADSLPGFIPMQNVHLIHRDWGWPDSDENEKALACVAEVLDAELGRTLVLGAGACRLAYDLHARHGASATVAVDIDPLPLLVAARVVQGAEVPLTEPRSNATELDR
jgi:hypothetical protein